MKRHSNKQQLVFLEWINKLIDDNFLKMELRERKKGMDLPFRKHLETLPEPSMLRQDAYKLLWSYQYFQNLKSDNLKHATKFIPQLEMPKDEKILKEKLNNALTTLGLPTL